MERDIFEQLADSWPAPIVARKEVSRFSGGVLNPRSMANLDSLGQGPPRISLGPRVIAYPTRALVEWMRNRAAKTKTGEKNEGV